MRGHINNASRSSFPPKKPFTSFLLFSSPNEKTLFYSQSFSQLTNFHASTQNIPPHLLQRMNNFNYEYREISKELQMILCYPLEDLSIQCVEPLIHELRTTSLLLDLAIHTVSSQNINQPHIIEKLERFSDRQKIATLIASDFIQLTSFNPKLYNTSISNIITKAISFVRDPKYITLKKTSYNNFTLRTTQNHPEIIIANEYLLYNFYTTILLWLKGFKITIEIEVVNPVAILIRISIPCERFLSNIQGYSLIATYIPFVTGFFNGRAWLTQNTINILYPLVIDELQLNHLVLPR